MTDGHETDEDRAGYEALLSGARRYLVMATEDVRPGHEIEVHEREDGARTGRSLVMAATYVTYGGHPCALSPEGLRPGFSIVSLEPRERPVEPTDADRIEASALRLSDDLKARGLPQAIVGTGLTDSPEGRVRAIYVYLSARARIRAPGIESWEGYPLVWRDKGNPRPVPVAGRW